MKYKMKFLLLILFFINIIQIQSLCSDYKSDIQCSCNNKQYQLQESEECKVNKQIKKQEFEGFKYDIEGIILCCKGLVCCDFNEKITILSLNQKQQQVTKHKQSLVIRKEKYDNKRSIKIKEKKERKVTLEEEFDGNPISVNTLYSHNYDYIAPFLSMTKQLVSSRCMMMFKSFNEDEEIKFQILTKLELIKSVYFENSIVTCQLIKEQAVDMKIGFKYKFNHKTGCEYIPSSGGNHIIPKALGFKIMTKHCFFSIDNDENAEMINFTQDIKGKLDILKTKDKNKALNILKLLQLDYRAMCLGVHDPTTIILENSEENYQSTDINEINHEYKMITKKDALSVTSKLEELLQLESFMPSDIYDVILGFINVLKMLIEKI